MTIYGMCAEFHFILECLRAKAKQRASDQKQIQKHTAFDQNLARQSASLYNNMECMCTDQSLL